MSTASAIPTSTSVNESTIIKAPLGDVWHFLKLNNFADFWSALKSSDFVKSQEETDVIKWTFKDGTELEVKQEEHSTIDHFITWSIITSKPALSYTSMISRVRCYAITTGEFSGSTFVEWYSNFSNDADAGVIEDAKFKRRDALGDLVKAATSKK